MKILDCTLRDGGYYTNWDFDDALVTTYIKAMNQLPIEYIELGYRNVPSNGCTCLLYTSQSPRDASLTRMQYSACK